MNDDELRKQFAIPEDYETKSLSGNKWTQTNSEGEELVNFQLKAQWSPPDPRKVVANQLLERIESGAPIRRPLEYDIPPADQRHMLEISVPDAHVGMVSPGEWDIEKAEKAVMWAVTEALKVSHLYPVEEILFPVGNDFFHFDTASNKSTSGGTQMDNAADWYEMLERGQSLMISAIERCSTVAPVHVLVVPGNHDRSTVIHSGQVLAAWFRNDENVTVETGKETYRKKRYGVNLLAFEHGKYVKPGKLAALMAATWPHDWAETKYREWHLGHRHTQAELEDFGVVIEHLPSLVPSDDWHKRNAFVGNRRAARAYVWSKTRGPVSRHSINLPE